MSTIDAGADGARAALVPAPARMLVDMAEIRAADMRPPVAPLDSQRGEDVCLAAGDRGLDRLGRDVTVAIHGRPPCGRMRHRPPERLADALVAGQADSAKNRP